ncbi:MAG: RagB/SusD family nutrient uptake outer membrane protein [Tannerella sp.]|nr:RagB/SusD family nutrient uptake outer membrane protein [Tannerella sp.]
MKRNIIILFACCMIAASCTDFLNVTKEKDQTEGTYFKTDIDAVSSLEEVFNNLFTQSDYTFSRGLAYEILGGSDDAIFGRTRNADFYRIINFESDGTEAATRNTWIAFTRVLQRANWIIYNLLRKSSLTPVESRCLGEAYFGRAFAHFYTAYRYGTVNQGVPFDRYEDYDYYPYEIPVQRASVIENYELIISDLEKSLELVPWHEEYTPADYGRTHKAVVLGYMVKTYAYWAQHDPSKWALIPALVDRIENEGHRALWDNYADAFTIANNWGKEHMLSINSTKENYSESCWFPSVVLDNGGWGKINGWGFFKPTLSLRNEFTENDKRRPICILEYGDKFSYFGEERTYYSTVDLESGFQFGKYMDAYRHEPYPTQECTDLNPPIMRFAEMLLFKAEALIMQNKNAEAGPVLSRISARGDGTVYTSPTMDDLKHERRCELAGEQTDRLMDLKRWGDYDKLRAPKLGRHYENRADPTSTWTPVEIWPARTFDPAKNMVLPYDPVEVLKADGALKQNSGYN